MEDNQYYIIIPRHDTSTNWMINNPILAFGEYGIEDDTHRVKRGDGTSNWETLPYETFGIDQMITFESIAGSWEDNKELKNEIDSKLSGLAFQAAGNKAIVGLQLLKNDSSICNIVKLTADIEDDSVKEDNLIIKSSDDTIRAEISDEDGVKVIDIRSISNKEISDFEPFKEYHINQLIVHNNNLYKANSEFVSSEEFNEEDWTLIISSSSENIKYDNTNSSLEADSIQDAVDELDVKIIQNNTAINEINEQLKWNEYE